MKRWGVWILGGSLIMAACSWSMKPEAVVFNTSSNFSDGVFQNKAEFEMSESGTLAKILWRYMTETRVDAMPVEPVPVHTMKTSALIEQNTSGVAIYRLGHSSLLLAADGEFWLIDPVFSERASPFSWIGPKRFHNTPLALAQLPPITGVLISHDHYDHLDKATITQLRQQVEHFVVPLGVGNHLREWGVKNSRIHELDWWQSLSVGELELTATPSQHFSGRGLTDRNKTLWSSWVIKAVDKKIYFSGDSGYFDGFKEIGERLGPFDLTIMENGAYDRNWSQVHMTPEETLQAHLDLKGEVLLPVHNGTFDLAMHPWYEPLERLDRLAAHAKVTMVTPEVGQRLSLVDTSIAETQRWWRNRPLVSIDDQGELKRSM